MSHAQRVGLAQELHDGIAQDLVGIGYSVDLLLAAPDTPTITRVDLRTLRFRVDAILEKVRSEIHQLHSGDGQGLSAKIAESAEELCEGFNIELSLKEVPLDPRGDLSYGVHQIAREFLRNAVHHSGAKRIEVTLDSSEVELSLFIHDDGLGGLAETPHHFGIVGAKTRALDLGGTLAIESNVKGTSITLKVPLHPDVRP